MPRKLGGMPRTVISIRIDVALLQMIDSEAIRRNVTRSEIIEEAIKEYLGVADEPEPKQE